MHSRPKCRGNRTLDELTEEEISKRRPCRYCCKMDQIRGEECLICRDPCMRDQCHGVCEGCTRSYVDTLLQNPTWNGEVTCPCGSGQRLAVSKKMTEYMASMTGVQQPLYKRCIIEKTLEEITTLRCPHCHAAFFDFEGCCAIQCRCGEYFCALCFEKNENRDDSHQHVANCRLNPCKGDYYVSTESWHKIMNTRKFFRLWELTCSAHTHTSSLHCLTIVREAFKHDRSIFPRGMVCTCAVVFCILFVFFPRLTGLACFIAVSI